MAIRSGWVRFRPLSHGDVVETRVLCVGPAGEWSIGYMPDRVTTWRFDDDPDSTLDTILQAINRYEVEDSEIVMEHWWHNPDGSTIARLTDEFYYTNLLELSAKAIVQSATNAGTPPDGTPQ